MAILRGQRSCSQEFRRKELAVANRRGGKLRVLHVVSSLDFGGVESRMVSIALGSYGSRFDHHFCAITRGGHAYSQITEAGSVCEVIGASSKIPSLSAFLGLIGVVRRLRPAIVHAHGAEANFHSMLAISASFFRQPIGICEEIGIPHHGRFARLMFRILYSRAAVVIAVSRSTMRRVLELGEAKKTKVRVIDSPVRAIAQRSSFRGALGVFTIGFVGRLESIKNPLALVEALTILRGKGIRAKLLFVGEGSLRSQILERAKSLRLGQFVRMVGYVPNPEVLFEEVDVLVQPSVSEGLSIALLEAMSAGLPVITTLQGGSPEVVADGVTGWLLADNRPESIANKVLEVMTLSPQSIIEVGDRASSLVSERFSVQRYIQELERLYSRLALR